MNYLKYLMLFMQLIPSIANDINVFHSGKPASEKIDAANATLVTATRAVSDVLSPEDGQIATVAGAAAQAILATTVQAVHDATNPPATT